jgi:hypothetical protein
MTAVRVRCVGDFATADHHRIEPCGWEDDMPLTLETTSQGIPTGNYIERCPQCDSRVDWNGPATDHPTTVAGPTPDLQQAIHAATKALDANYDWDGYDVPRIARYAVEAAWGILTAPLADLEREVDLWTAAAGMSTEELEQLQANSNRAHLLKVEVKDLERRLGASDDQHADLQARCAELRDLLKEMYDLATTECMSTSERVSLGVGDPRTIKARVRAALQVQGPPHTAPPQVDPHPFVAEQRSRLCLLFVHGGRTCGKERDDPIHALERDAAPEENPQ